MIASFDIGEKNFAYAIGTIDSVAKLVHVNVMQRKRQTIVESCDAISKVLRDEDFSNCDLVVIEQQMRANVRAQRLSQHVWTWFKLMIPRLNPTFVKASLKTLHFLGSNSLTAKSRKRWSVDKMTELLTERCDETNLEYYNSLSKKDDVADAYLQLIAYQHSQRDEWFPM
jgi:hypothetical protein